MALAAHLQRLEADKAMRDAAAAHVHYARVKTWLERQVARGARGTALLAATAEDPADRALFADVRQNIGRLAPLAQLLAAHGVRVGMDPHHTDDTLLFKWQK